MRLAACRFVEGATIAPMGGRAVSGSDKSVPIKARVVALEHDRERIADMLGAIAGLELREKSGDSGIVAVLKHLSYLLAIVASSNA